jgi:MFS-type transporter involved in bile tolerance (Atg22 family)
MIIAVFAFALVALVVGVVLVSTGRHRPWAGSSVCIVAGITLAVHAVPATLFMVGFLIVLALALNNLGSNK